MPAAWPASWVVDGEDIFIAGTTDYGYSQSALHAIMTEWARTDESNDVRVANLTRGNGVPLLDAYTVYSNGGGNTLTGGDGLDVIFASPAWRPRNRF